MIDLRQSDAPSNTGHYWLAAGVYAGLVFGAMFYFLDPTLMFLAPPFLGIGLAGLVYVAVLDYRMLVSLLIAPCLILGPMALIAQYMVDASSQAMMLSTGVTVVLVGGIGFIVRGTFAKDRVPDVLAGRVPGGTLIVERNGVQFCATMNRRRLPVGTTGTLRVYVQNAWNKSVRVKVRCKARRDEGLRRGRLQIPAGKVRLSAGEVGVLHIPVTVEPGAKGDVEILPTIRVWGAWGFRIRPRFRPLAPEATPFVFAVIALALQQFEFGGGLAIDVSIGGDAYPDTDQRPPEVRYEQLWVPGEDEA